MEYNIAFAPELPLWLLSAVCILLALPVLYAVARRVRGSWLRLLAFAALALALFNPSLLVEERESLKSVVAVVTDKSSSQRLDGRDAQSEAARKALLDQLSRQEGLEVREIETTDQISSTTDVSTALIGALQSGLRDVPGNQLAGAILITDGQVHDIPENLSQLGINAPIHTLITGEENDRDRRIVITEAPRYGVVGEPYEIVYRVEQQGFASLEPVAVSIYLDGELVTVEEIVPGEVSSFNGEVAHGGRNIIELRVEEHRQEITATNNRVFVNLNGIRENLRVLLVSGEPHSGERTWRNLLKSDASVDLVHFTILRPPEKQDGTPISQLSLIAFPTRELFVEKIDEFDLIIFDRYSRRGVLPILYFDNIARYVRDGGAVLLAAGPEFGQPGSIAQTPLDDVIPALPDGNVTEAPFKPLISQTGNRHPVTRGLDGGNGDDPDWSRWFRNVGVRAPDGEVVMRTSRDEPLLVLQRYDEGRVALLLSDHAWLWARGFEGGGPHVQLLRRMAHWLMKEPELEEERLTAERIGSRLQITRQTLGGDPGEVEVRRPDGSTFTLELSQDENGDGIFSTWIDDPDIGLYQIASGELNALIHMGPPNPREYAQVLSTPDLMEPVTEATGGSIQRINRTASNMPRILTIRPGANASGNDWIGLQNTGASVLKGINRISLFIGFLGLSILLLATAAMWTREGR